MKNKLILIVSFLLIVGAANCIDLTSPNAVYSGSSNPTKILSGDLIGTNDLIFGDGNNIYIFSTGDLIENKSYSEADQTISESHLDFVLGDFNDEGNEDLLIASSSGAIIYYGENLPSSKLTLSGSVSKATSCDIQKDSISDIIVSNSNNIYLVNGSSILAEESLGNSGITITGSSIKDIKCADINNNNQDDLIVLADQLYVFYGEEINNKTSLSESEIKISLSGTNPNSIKVGKIDSNSDGYDIIVGDYSYEKVYVLFENLIQDGTLTSLADIYISEESGDETGKSIAIGNFDGNNYEDILIGAPKNDDNGQNAGKVYLINGDDADGGSLALISYNYFGVSPDNAGTITGVADLNDDGKDEIIIGTAQNKIYISTWDSFQQTNNPPSKVNLSEPSDEKKTNDNTPKFNWTSAIDPEGDSIKYKLEISNLSDFSEINYNFDNLTNRYYTPSSLSDGEYWWRVKSKDSTGYNTSEKRNLIIDTTGPNFTLSLPSSISLEGSIRIDCNAEDKLTNIIQKKINLTKPSGFVYEINNTDDRLFNNDETNETGTYKVLCYAMDELNNTYNISSTFKVNSSSSSSNDNENTVTTKTTKKTLSGSRGTKIEFTFDGETHSATILNVLSSAVVVLIESEPIQVTLKEGETKEVDLNNDGSSDVYLILKELQPDVSAELEVTVLDTSSQITTTNEESDSGEPETLSVDETKENSNESESKKNYVLWIVIGIVLAILFTAGVFYYFSKRKGKKEEEYEF